jgi:hypothetical protein
MNTLNLFKSAFKPLIIVAALTQVSWVSNKTQTGVLSALSIKQDHSEKNVEKTGFGILVLNWQSIDPTIVIPPRLLNKLIHKGMSTKEILEQELATSSDNDDVENILTKDWKLVPASIAARESITGKSVYDIRAIQWALNQKAKAHGYPTILATGNFVQADADLLLKTSFTYRYKDFSLKN